MSRLTDNDKNWGPFTWGPSRYCFGIVWSSGGGYWERGSGLRINAFGRIIWMKLPNILKPFGERYDTHPREFGFSLSDMGNGYDFLQIFFGPQTNDSRTTRNWCKHLPWKGWRHVRTSFYEPDGKHFWTQLAKDKRRKGIGGFDEQWKQQELVPKVHFGFEDYDGEMIVATAYVEEMEWKFGEGWFKWLSLFRKPKIRRSLDLHFSEEVGPEKGSWKGGTTGHGIDMLSGESTEAAFRRYCDMTHERKGRQYKLRFIGPCGPPPPKVFPEEH